MMNRSDDNSIKLVAAEFRELVQLLLANQLSENQFQRLYSLMQNNSEARRYYLDQIDIHLGLEKLATVQSCVGADPVANLPNIVPSTSRKSIAWTKLALAASILLCVTLWIERWFSSDSKSSITVVNDQVIDRKLSEVRVSQGSSAEFLGQLSPALGSLLTTNQPYILTSGSVELQFPSGATAIIDAPAYFKIAAKDRLDLSSGRCSVHAPDGAEGFQVETPLANVVDLGTRFAISVGESGETEVQVVEGEAEVRSKSVANDWSDAPKLLKEHDTLLCSAEAEGGNQSIAFDASRYRYGLPDRVVSYQAASTDEGGVRDLLALTVQRGQRLQSYRVEELIPAAVTHFRTNDVPLTLSLAYQFRDESPLDKATMLDRALDTGLINPGGSRTPLQSNPTESTPGLGIRFLQPVCNSIGPDVVLFELQCYMNPLRGDSFHVSPLAFEDGLQSITIKQFDISLMSQESAEVVGFGVLQHRGPIGSLLDLPIVEHVAMHRHANFRALAVGIDLSDLGYPQGAMVEELFFQDAMDDDDRTEQSMVDPVFIAGLPQVKE